MKEELNSNLDNFLRRLGKDNLRQMNKTIQRMIEKPGLSTPDVFALGNSLDLFGILNDYIAEMD